MHTKAVSIIVVAFVMVAGGIWYMNSSGVETALAPSGEESENNLAALGGTLADLMAGNQNVTCSVKHTTEAGTSEGKVYINGGKVRADFSTSVAELSGSAIESHMITDGEWLYTWSGAAPQGMKMKVAEVTGEAGTAGMSGSWQDMYQAGAYDCVPWVPDATFFMPPSSVTFMELGATMP